VISCVGRIAVRSSLVGIEAEDFWRNVVVLVIEVRSLYDELADTAFVAVKNRRTRGHRLTKNIPKKSSLLSSATLKMCDLKMLERYMQESKLKF